MVDEPTLIRSYRARFDGAAPTVLVRAPGRVNLIGEHVDYNDGLVLPVAINRGICLVAGPGSNCRIRAVSAAMNQEIEFDWRDDCPAATAGWGVYVRGVAAELAAAGVRPTGARMFIDGDLPVGAGLASSAALEVAAALALLSVAGQTMPARELAHLCRRAEHRYAGVPCGIMDQFACVMAVDDHALLLDCRSEEVRHIRWPRSDAAVVVIDSMCRHKLSISAYTERVRECGLATEHCRHADPSIRSLRDLSPDRLGALGAGLDEVLFRRARHVVSEIDRTFRAAAAMEAGDMAVLGQAMNESHYSLRDDYAVSSPQLDDLAEVVRSVPGVFGARMTGAGFGGCVVAVAVAKAVPAIAAAVAERYDRKYGVQAGVMVTGPCQGATVTTMTET